MCGVLWTADPAQAFLDTRSGWDCYRDGSRPHPGKLGTLSFSRVLYKIPFTFLRRLPFLVQLGVLFEPGAYLRDPWNVLDALCTLTTLISVAAENRWPLLHVFRVFRALRLAQTAPGLRVSGRQDTCTGRFSYLKRNQGHLPEADDWVFWCLTRFRRQSSRIRASVKTALKLPEKLCG